MNQKKVFRRLEETISALEQEVLHLDPDEGEWAFVFQLLRSYDRFTLISYREQLLIGIIPECVLEDLYQVETFVDPPRAHCYTMADFDRYSEPDWLGLSGSALTDRLPRNEFGYLHPSDERSFLGISQETYDRLHALYRRCPDLCRERVEQALDTMADFLLDALEG